jgi:signal peptidase I
VTEPTATDPTSPAPTDEHDRSVHHGRRPRRRVIVEWSIVVAVAVAASLLMRSLVFQTYFIPSGSMEPTLQIGDRIIVDKLSVDFGTINRGDIVVFLAPSAVSHDCNDAVTDLVKRVIGLPGDHVTSKGNVILVNGRPLKESWTHVEPLGVAIGHVTVPANHYFMIGDNHPFSCDSRTWGTVARSAIIGKAFVRIWPLARVGFL